MSKTRNKSGSEVEHLRGEIRRLKSQVRYYKKRCNELSRRQNFFQNIDPDIDAEEEYEEKNDIERCPSLSCGKGTIYEVDLGRIVVAKCDVCDWKETRKVKNAKEEERI